MHKVAGCDDHRLIGFEIGLSEKPYGARIYAVCNEKAERRAVVTEEAESFGGTAVHG